MVADDGRIREMTALPLSQINYWLATIHSNRVPDIKTRLPRSRAETAGGVYGRRIGAEFGREAGAGVSKVVSIQSPVIRIVRRRRAGRAQSYTRPIHYRAGESTMGKWIDKPMAVGIAIMGVCLLLGLG